MDVEPDILSELSGNRDLFEILSEFLTHYTEDSEVNEIHEKVISIGQLEIDEENRTLTGTITSGEYGYASDLMNIETGEITHSRSISEAEILPFFFSFHIPEGVDRAILIFQKFKNYGVKTVFLECFKRYFVENVSSDFYIRLNKLTTEQEMNELLSARVLKMRLIKFDGTDIEHTINNCGDVEQSDINTELVIGSNRNKVVPRNLIESVLSGMPGGQRDHIGSGVYEVEDFHYTYDTVKFEVEEPDGRKRTYDLGKLDEIAERRDITEEVEIAADGHPNYDSIKTLALEYNNELRQQIIRGG